MAKFLDNVQQNRVVFLQNQNNKIELLEPLNEKSSIYHFKEGYHHICYEVENEDAFFKNFKQLKIGKIFMKPIQAPAIDNREIVFAYLTNGTFVEFLRLNSNRQARMKQLKHFYPSRFRMLL